MQDWITRIAQLTHLLWCQIDSFSPLHEMQQDGRELLHILVQIILLILKDGFLLQESLWRIFDLHGKGE